MRVLFSFILLFSAPFTSVASAETVLIARPVGTRTAKSIRALKAIPGARLFEGVFASHERKILDKMKRHDLAESLKIHFSGDLAARKFRDRAKHLPFEFEENELTILTSDPYEDRQWGLQNSGQAQTLTYGDFQTIDLLGGVGEDIGLSRLPQGTAEPSKKVIVAVLDTGVDYNHPDLKAHIVRKESECKVVADFKKCRGMPGKNEQTCAKEFVDKDTDGNGYPMDCSGWNLVPKKSLFEDLKGDWDAQDEDRVNGNGGHGTHVAGIIAAVAGNGLGVRGVAQNALILPVKVIMNSPNSPVRPQALAAGGGSLPSPRSIEGPGKWGTGFVDILARGMLYAMSSGAQVINISMAWPTAVDTSLMRQMLDLAASRGVAVVTSAGNDSTLANIMPCSHSAVICVGAHGNDGRYTHFSNYGSMVDLNAPGFRVLSTWPMRKNPNRFTAALGYEFMDGTSMAAPFVSGAMAFLLGYGMPREEAYARLVLGARPTGQSVFHTALFPEKYSRSGNLDISRALQATPQPLIFPATKEKIKMNWDRRSRTLPYKISLKNFWKDALFVTVQADLAPMKTPLFSHLETTKWDFLGWSFNAVQTLEGVIAIDDPWISQDLAVDLTVEAHYENSGVTRQKFRVEMELITALKQAHALGEVEEVLLADGPLSPGVSIRSVRSIGKEPNPDYLLFAEAKDAWTLQLLRYEQGAYRITAKTQMKPITSGYLDLVAKADFNQDRQDDFMVIFRVEGKNSSNPDSDPMKIFYFDKGLSLISSQEFQNSTTVFTDGFEWMKVTEKGTPRMVPAWISQGQKPEIERPSYDPWDPKPVYPNQAYLYYFASDGLRSIEAPKDYVFAQMLIQSEQQKKDGVIPVVLGKGKGYRLDYFLSFAQDGKLGDLIPFVLPEQRNLLGMQSVLEVKSLIPDVSDIGTAYVGRSVDGNLRTTILPYSAPDLKAMDLKQTPATAADSVVWIPGVYMGRQRMGIFSNTHYDYQFHDLKSGEVAVTTLNRFSYLSDFVAFNHTNFPITIASGTEEDLPALMISALGSTSGGMEIIQPWYDTQGALMGLVRPARFHLDAQGCRAQSRIERAFGSPAKAVFLCGDRFLRVPISSR